MTSERETPERLLQEILEAAKERNRTFQQGTPLGELKDAVESALASLPPLEFAEYADALNDSEAAMRLVKRAPEIIGWTPDQIVEWVEAISKKV